MEVLIAIHDLAVKHGTAPTLREIAAAIEVNSHNAARYWIAKLEVMGLIERRRGLQRTTRVTEAGKERIERRLRGLG